MEQFLITNYDIIIPSKKITSTNIIITKIEGIRERETDEISSFFHHYWKNDGYLHHFYVTFIILSNKTSFIMIGMIIKIVLNRIF